MKFKKPKNTDEISWTKHSIEKMQFYNLSENRVKRVLRNPNRKEDGIAPGTLALMQRTGSRKHPTEIWMMFQNIGKKIRIISAWRYPGISPKGKEIPIPQDILEELNSEGF
jgi:hypothetical protein